MITLKLDFKYKGKKAVIKYSREEDVYKKDVSILYIDGKEYRNNRFDKSLNKLKEIAGRDMYLCLSRLLDGRCSRKDTWKNRVNLKRDSVSLGIYASVDGDDEKSICINILTNGNVDIRYAYKSNICTEKRIYYNSFLFDFLRTTEQNRYVSYAEIYFRVLLVTMSRLFYSVDRYVVRS